LPPPDLDTARFYENHIRRYGYDYRALGFGRRSSQEKRFASLLSDIGLETPKEA